MSDTGLRGLMARFFGGPTRGRGGESETRESLERATGTAGTRQRPSPAEDEFDHGDKDVPTGRPPS